MDSSLTGETTESETGGDVVGNGSLLFSWSKTVNCKWKQGQKPKDKMASGEDTVPSSLVLICQSSDIHKELADLLAWQNHVNLKMKEKNKNFHSVTCMYNKSLDRRPSISGHKKTLLWVILV